MSIKWKKVTWYSQIVAIVLFVGVFCLGIFLGRKVGVNEVLGPSINDVSFSCDAGKSIHAVFYNREVHVALSGDVETFLSQTISADGGRYANADESLVFWAKGQGAFVTENGVTTYANCVVVK